MKTKLIAALAIVALAISASAKTDVKESLELLNANAENSEFNYKQYQDNLDIVNKNVEQTRKAISELQKLRTQLISNTKNVDKNKLALADMEKEILVLKQNEQAKISQESKQIEEVQKVLEKLEDNKRKRQENILAYDKMTEQVQQEQRDWDTQVQQMATLQTEISSKEAKAADEKKTWEAKRKDYEAEAKKWGRQTANSRSTYDKVKKLAD